MVLAALMVHHGSNTNDGTDGTDRPVALNSGTRYHQWPKLSELSITDVS
jgi:hypothetical protein